MKVRLQNSSLKPRIRLLTHEELHSCTDTEYVVKENNCFYLAKRDRRFNTPAFRVQFIRDFTIFSKPNQSQQVFKILGAK